MKQVLNVANLMNAVNKEAEVLAESNEGRAATKGNLQSQNVRTQGRESVRVEQIRFRQIHSIRAHRDIGMNSNHCPKLCCWAMARLLQVRQLKYKQGSKVYQYLGISLQVPSVGDRIEAGFPDCSGLAPAGVGMKTKFGKRRTLTRQRMKIAKLQQSNVAMKFAHQMFDLVVLKDDSCNSCAPHLALESRLTCGLVVLVGR